MEDLKSKYENLMNENKQLKDKIKEYEINEKNSKAKIENLKFYNESAKNSIIKLNEKIEKEDNFQKQIKNYENHLKQKDDEINILKENCLIMKIIYKKMT